MTTTYGLTAAGFVVKTQQPIITEIQQALQAVFGQNINLSPESNFGQLVGIFSEREALIWQIAQAVYSSQYPSGAEGTSVDNVLSFNNLKRLQAAPTRTAANPVLLTNGITEYPLVLLGTAGTVVPAGSIVQTSASPPVQFTINSTVTIQPASNAIQGIFLSNMPTMGAFSLSIVSPAGNTLGTPAIEWNSLAAQTLLNFSSVPSSSTSFKLVLTQAGAVLTTAAIPTNGVFPTAAAIQSAITALTGYAVVTVSGSAGSYTITWGAIANPVTTITANTTGVTITPTDSVQSGINNLFDSAVPNYPFTDVVVTTGSQGFNANFGVGTVVGSNPVSSAQPEPLFLLVSNSLMNGANVTNVQISNVTVGAPAQAVAAATCTVTGPNFVAAGSINTIGTPISGWSAVNNQLDCLTGTNVENDTAALIRRSSQLNAQANGPLVAIIEKVSALTGVTQAIGFQNLNEAALQNITFAGTPLSGGYQLAVNGHITSMIFANATAAQIQSAITALPGLSVVLVTGNSSSGFSVDFNGALGGQPMPLIMPLNSTLNVGINTSFGRPGKSIEIVALGGADADIAAAILASKPGGIQTFGNTGPIQSFDALGNQYLIYFSRPTQVPIYMSLTLLTDTYNVPGNSGSGINPKALFNPSSIATIQEDLVNIGNAVKIGGLIVGFGTNGLVGAFNNVPGILNYTLSFGTAPNPSSNANIQLLPEQAGVFETFNIAVGYT